jgi:hypothetical protein
LKYFQALLISIVTLSYLGNEGGRLVFGLGDFLGVGTSVGFAIVIPLVFLTYLGDGNILFFVSLIIYYQQKSLIVVSIQEAMLSLIGASLFLVISIITDNSYSHPQYGSPAGKVLAGLCAATGGSFVVNLAMICCAMRGA